MGDAFTRKFNGADRAFSDADLACDALVGDNFGYFNSL
jgi:hypothetical protein